MLSIYSNIQQNALAFLNNSLRFALETEIDGQLPFFGLGNYKKFQRLTFTTYRKPTHTECYINSNGYNPKSQQHAVSNSLVYRLLSTPLEQTEYIIDYMNIY